MDESTSDSELFKVQGQSGRTTSNDDLDPKVQAAALLSTYRDHNLLAAVPDLYDRVTDDMSTGDEFQNEMEDNLYEKKESKEDKFGDLLGRICLTAFTVAFVFACIVGCIALVKLVL